MTWWVLVGAGGRPVKTLSAWWVVVGACGGPFRTLSTWWVPVEAGAGSAGLAGAASTDSMPPAAAAAAELHASHKRADGPGRPGDMLCAPAGPPQLHLAP